MIQHIAVALDGPEQADRIAPCLSNIVQPGVVIDFLIPAKARQAVWLLTRTTALATHNSSTVTVFEQQWGLALEEEKLIAERKLAQLSDSLRNHGAATAVRLYSGSLKKTLAQLRQSHPESLLVLHPLNGWPLGRAVRAMLTKIGLRSPVIISTVSLTYQTHMRRAH